MSRLHGALSRASEGKAPILPADGGVSPTQGLEASQSAFAVKKLMLECTEVVVWLRLVQLQSATTP